MNNWLDLSDNANTFLSTVVDGFVDTSGGNIVVRENQHLEISGDASFNQGASFAVPTLKTDVLDTTGLVELSLSKTEFVENPSFSQVAYDISGAESGGLAGQSISKNLAGDIIAVGAPLNSGGGTARGEVRVYQKNNDSWLQLGNDLNGTTDNEEFGHSLDLNGDGTILAVGTKDNSHKTIIYKYDSGSWSLYGNTIDNQVSYELPIVTTTVAATSGQQIGDDIGVDSTWPYGVAMSSDGNIVALGAPYSDDNGNNSGSTLVFQRDTSNTTTSPIGWTQLGTLIGGEGTSDESGDSIAMNSDGSIIAIGAAKNASNGYRSGHVRIWQRDTNATIGWTQIGQDIIGEASADNSKHCALSSDGHTVAIGAYENDATTPYSTTGHVRVWKYDGTSWNQIGQDIDGVDSTDYFGGYNVALSSDGTIVAAGSPRHDNYKGHVRVFLYNGVDAWNQLGPDIDGPTDATTLAGYGVALSSDGTIVAVGGSPNSGYVGSVRVYQYDNPGSTGGSWNQLGNAILGDEAGSDWGRYVALSSDGTILAASAAEYNSNQGRIKIYQYTNSDWNQLGSSIDGDGTGRLGTEGVNLSSDGSIVAGIEYGTSGKVRVFETGINRTVTSNATLLSASTKPKLNKEGDKLTILSEQHLSTLSGNGQVQTYEYSASDVSWNYLGDKIESAAFNDISGGDIAINDEGNMIAIGYPQSKSSIQGTYSYSVIAGSGIYEIYGEEFTSDTANPVLTFKRGSTYNLTISTGGSHPFYIQTTDNGGEYDSANVYNNGVTNNGTGSGIITFVVPSDAPDTLYYVCQYHGNMGNSISIVNESGNDGRTKVFKYNTTDSSWNQVGNNIDGEGQAGTAVVMDGSGDFVAIGSPNVNAGEVNVYQNVADTWTLYGNKIQGQADNDQFGTSIDITPAGNILAVGAVNANGGKGNVNIYQYNETDSSWNKVGGDLSGDAVGDLTGTSVKLNQLGTEVSVGEPDYNTSGRVRTFEIEHNKFYNGMTNPTFGIGVTNSTNRLDVDGTVYIDGKLQTTNLSQTSGTTTVSGDLTLNGSISVDAVNNSALTYDTDMSVNLLKRLFVNPNDISSYGETTQTHASDVVDTSVFPHINQIGDDILVSNATADENYGYSVDINGDGTILAVGASYNSDIDSFTGKVLMYQYDSGQWNSLGDITGYMVSSNGIRLGSSVSLNYSGTRVAIGAYYDYTNETRAGSVQCWEYSNSTWNQLGNTFAYGEDSFELVGDIGGVAINKNTDSNLDGKYICTSSYNYDGTGSTVGRARVYEWNGSAWNQIGNDIIGDSSSEGLGKSCSINNDGTVIVTGNYVDDDNGSNSGSIKAFEYDSGTGSWSKKGSTIHGLANQDYFGVSVAINGDGSIIAGYAHGNDSNGNTSGLIRIYQFINNDWTQIGQNIYGDTSSSGSTGNAIALNNTGHRILIGFYYNDDNGSNTGGGRIYDYNSSTGLWNQIGEEIHGPVGPAGETGSYLGYSVGLNYDGTKFCLSAPDYENSSSQDTGMVRAYEVVPFSASQTFSEDLSFNHSLVVPGNLVIIDGSNNTNYGSYTTYTSADVDNSAATPTNKSYHVGKSKSNVFNIVNQDNIGVYMNTGDTSFTSTSDERLKHNIQDTENSLEKICALQPRKFKWKYNDKSESGFIAQEIEKVFPEMVDENTLPDGKTIKGVNHSSLLSLIHI